MPDYLGSVVIDDITFELAPGKKNPSNPDRVCLRKLPKLVDSYFALQSELQGCNMVEVGIDQGGSTSFFYKLFNPKGLLALELSSEPLPSLDSFLAKHDSQQKVQICLGVNQADTIQVPHRVQEKFGEENLDLVVDDACHALAETTATFEMLFPKLRENGLCIIEDSSTDHLFEARSYKKFSAMPLQTVPNM